ncbi:ketoisovalerate oxidoreductase [Candidatus Shapirobacteria bacterium]|nr:ketoisovalerate oxidoreductase [Candidatus Shapirobacteria bacterium]
MIKILIAGEGGQGVQVIAEILAKAAFQEGQKSSYIPNFGVEQRGGVSLAFVVIDNQPIIYPKFAKADIVAIFSQRSHERIKEYLDEKTRIIKGPAITQKDAGLPSRVWNVWVLGQINKEGQMVKKESLVKALEERFTKQFSQNPELRELDLKALNA